MKRAASLLSNLSFRTKLIGSIVIAVAAVLFFAGRKAAPLPPEGLAQDPSSSFQAPSVTLPNLPLFQPKVGTHLLYDFSFSSDGMQRHALASATKNSSDSSQKIKSRLSGRWKEVVTQRDHSGFTTVVTLELDELSSELNGARNELWQEAITRDLTKSFVVSRSAGYRIDSILVPRTFSASSQHLLLSLLAKTSWQWSENAPSSWQAEEDDGNGRALVLYERGANQRLIKTKKSYIQAPRTFRSDPEQVQIHVEESKQELQLAAAGDGFFEQLSGHESLRMTKGAQELGRDLQEFRWTLQKAWQGDAKDALALQKEATGKLGGQAWRELDARGLAIASDLDERMQKEALGATTLDELRQDFRREAERAFGGERAETTLLYLKLAAYARLHDAQLMDYASWLASEKSKSLSFRNLVLALATAGGPKAQALLVETLQKRQADSEAMHVVFSSLSQLQQMPEAATVAAITQLAQKASDPGATAQERDLASSAALCLGTFGALLADGAPDRSDQIRREVEAHLGQARSIAEQTFRLAVLGNLGGSDENIRALDSYLQSTDATVRLAAFDALRLFQGDKAQKLLLHASLADDDAKVRAASLSALALRLIDDETAAKLQARLRKEPAAEARLALLSALAATLTGRSLPPEFLADLGDVAQHDDDANVRHFARTLLASIALKQP